MSRPSLWPTRERLFPHVNTAYTIDTSSTPPPYLNLWGLHIKPWQVYICTWRWLAGLYMVHIDITKKMLYNFLNDIFLYVYIYSWYRYSCMSAFCKFKRNGCWLCPTDKTPLSWVTHSLYSIHYTCLWASTGRSVNGSGKPTSRPGSSSASVTKDLGALQCQDPRQVCVPGRGPSIISLIWKLRGVDGTRRFMTGMSSDDGTINLRSLQLSEIRPDQR